MGGYTFCLSIHQVIGIWVVLQLLTTIYNAVMTIHAQFFCEHVCNSLEVYLQVELLDHVITVK